MFFLDKLCDDRIYRTPRLISGQRGGGLEHVAERFKRFAAELEIALAPHAFAIFQELAIAGDVGRVERMDRGFERDIIIRIIEPHPVGPIEPVEWRDGDKLDIGGDVLAR